MDANLVSYIPYISIPLISAFVGWVTNLIAVRMLFRPYQPIRILGITFQGLIPRRQIELADRIGETVEANFVSHSDIANVVQSPAVHAEIVESLERELERFIQERFASIPMIGSFLQGAMGADMKRVFVDEIRQTVPVMLDRLMHRVESELSFRDIVRKKVEAFDLKYLEEIIYRIASQELRAIELWGGVLGFIVGLVQVAIVVLFS